MAGNKFALATLCISLIGLSEASASEQRHSHEFRGLTITIDRVQVGDRQFPNNYLIIDITQADGSRIAVAKHPIDGSMGVSWVRDMDRDRNPEIIVATHSFGSGSYGELVVFEFENGTFGQKILPPMPQQFSQEYRGHDSFNTSSDDISRRFKLYTDSDANCCPTGGDAEIEYAFTANQLVIKDIDRSR